MSRWITVGLVLLTGLAGTALAGQPGLGTAGLGPEPGRTDGPEGSEYGKGGYRYYRTGGAFFVEGLLGAAAVDVEDDASGADQSQTDLIAGAELGYMVEDWLALSAGYARIADQNTDLFSLGMRSHYLVEPFAYYFSLGAELYAPEVGDEKFGLVPGAGAEVMVGERVRVGLGYQHDFVLADQSIGIDRFTARVQVRLK
jgi:hypothetical protein